MLRKRFLIILIILLCVSFSTLSANIIYVDINGTGNYTTIQEGINAAVDGDTVLVYPGTYYENISYNGKNIVVASLFLTTQDTSYISQTIIDGNNTGNVVSFTYGEDSTAVLTGLTIQNSGNSSLNAGIICSSSPTITNNIISLNSHGIDCEYATPAINNNIISSNIYLGIECFESSPIIKGNIIFDNKSGIGLHGSSSSSIVKNNTIYSNINTGISCSYSAAIICNNIIFSNNGGIYCYRGALIITNNTISNCEHGISCRNSSPTITNTIIWGNVNSFYFDDWTNPYVVPSNPLIYYCCIEDSFPSQGTDVGGNIYDDPLFVNPESGDYHLQTGSPCIDAGDPCTLCNDLDGSRNDMGRYGGCNLYPNFTIKDFGEVGINYGKGVNDKTLDWTLYNDRDTAFIIENAGFINSLNFNLIDGNFPVNIASKSSYTFKICFEPYTSGTVYDTLVIISDDILGDTEAKILVSGTGISNNTLYGNISGVLSADNSPYLVIGDIEVSSGDSLVIEPGTEIRFTGYYTFTVRGKLIAEGTEEDSIIFTRHYATEESKWRGIEFYYYTGSIISYCRLEYSKTKAISCNYTNYSPMICNNTISDNGFGILCFNSSSPVISNNSIMWNDSGGILCSDSSPIIINNNIIFNLPNYGDGIECWDSSCPDIINNKIAYNNGNGIFCDTFSLANIVNNTIIHNSYGITCQDCASPTVINTIIWANNSDFKFNGLPSNPIISYCCIEEGFPSQGTNAGGNIYDDPMFVDIVMGDFHLQEESPCIDTGIPDTTGLNLPMFDLDGNLRILDGNNNGIAIIDMGCYEFVSDTTSVNKTNNILIGYKLNQNYPNPFNPKTIITFSVPKGISESASEIRIYNIKGEMVKKLEIQNDKSSIQKVIWNGKDDNNKPVSSGIYLYQLKCGEYKSPVKKMCLIK